MSSNLECVGLAADNKQGFIQLIQSAWNLATPLEWDADLYFRQWQDASGARMILGRDRTGDLYEFLPSYAGEPGVRLANVRMLNEEVSSGAVVDETGEQITAMAFELEQRHLLRRAPDSLDGLGAVVALGVNVTIHQDAAAFGDSDASLLDPSKVGTEPPPRIREMGLQWPTRFAAESFISGGLFASPADATAHARLAASVLSASMRRNSLTGQEFAAARVSLWGLELDVCLSATAHPRLPEIGNVIAGDVFLVASLAAALAGWHICSAGCARRVGSSRQPLPERLPVDVRAVGLALAQQMADDLRIPKV